jgi:hypothetical protein
MLRALSFAVLSAIAVSTSLRAAMDKVPCVNLRSAAECARTEVAAKGAAEPRQASSASDENVSDVQASGGVVRMEKVTVGAHPEDRPAPEASRWERMERALGPGRSAKREWVETYDNAGVRTACMRPCPTPLCCVRSDEFSLPHPRVPGGL